MLELLAASDPKFEQVVAIDSKFELFTRAWCIAELAAAHRMGIQQRVKLESQANLRAFEHTLQRLRVQEMHASRVEDIEEILRRIPNADAFNEDLRKLILEDLIPNWKSLDSELQFSCVVAHLRLEVACSQLAHAQ